MAFRVSLNARTFLKSDVDEVEQAHDSYQFKQLGKMLGNQTFLHCDFFVQMFFFYNLYGLKFYICITYITGT